MWSLLVLVLDLTRVGVSMWETRSYHVNMDTVKYFGEEG